uniref:Uncharacterized protein ycf20 n=1 Tax=Boldia erythrosiphon TaxID=74908 RepID=A0A1Y9TLQ6_9RHOD|nr:conserved hypothetical plastid protein [Boldia erythrosiphon]ARO90548.1 conserved hypothetical plastid protein [Boldia erythrosiphon]
MIHIMNSKFLFLKRGLLFPTQLFYPLSKLIIQSIFLLIGFFFATVLATLPGQTGDWGVVAGGRHTRKKLLINIVYVVNTARIGIVYGFFVDAFKLGS